MLKSKKKVNIKLSKICQNHQKLREGQTFASRFTETVQKSSSAEESRKCHLPFKLFCRPLGVILLNLKGEPATEYSCRRCWLLQTVPGFADFAVFAGVVEITVYYKHKRVLLNVDQVYGNKIGVRTQFCLFKQQ